MKIDEKFNKRAANLIDVGAPWINHGPQYAERIMVTFSEQRAIGMPVNAQRDLRLHMTQDEALAFARDLITAALREKGIQ